MRRGIGVGYVQEKTSVKDQMKELGSRITAERVTDVLDQLEELEKQLRVLAKRYERDIQEDPVVRSRFRQLGESLGLDLLSSQKNIFSGVLGIGTFYYRLASKVVECCMTMRKYFGSYVPLSEVVVQTKKTMGGLLLPKPQSSVGGWSNRTQKNNPEEVEITQDDVLTALKKLRCFGSGYDVVTLGGVVYIRTSGDGAEGNDSTHILNFLLEQQEKQHQMLPQERRKEKGGVPGSPKHAAATMEPRNGGTGISSSSSLAGTTAAGCGNDINNTSLSTTVDHSRLGAAYVLGVSTYTSLPITDRIRVSSLPFSLSQIVEELHWEEHRAIAGISRLVQDGTLWVDYPYVEQASVTNTIHLGTENSKHVTALRAVEKKGKAKLENSIDGGAVYWFLPQR